DVAVDAVTVDVAHEYVVAEVGRERAAEVDERAAVGMAAAQGKRVGRANGSLEVGPGVMQVIGDGRDSLVGVEARWAIAPRLVMAPLDHVEQVRIDAVRDEALTEVVEIDTPRVGRSVHEVFEDESRRVNAVDAAVAVDALVGRRAWPADVRRARATVPRVQPAIRAPREPVHQVVPALLVAEAIENQFRRAVRFAVAVAIRDEVEPRRGDDPDAAESDLDSGDVVEPLVKHGALVGAAIAVGV